MKDIYKRNWDYFSNQIVDYHDLGIKSQNFCEIESYMNKAVQNQLIPGGVLLIAYHGNIILNQAFGYSQIVPTKKHMVVDNIFDIASLTKVVATWPCILKLIENNKINLHDTLDKFFDFDNRNSNRKINIEQLLTHTSGLPERTYLKQYGSKKEDIIYGICNEPLMYHTGSKVVYSNRGFILLGEIVERVSKVSLSQYARDNIWRPLEMFDTSYNPETKFINRIVPTEYVDGEDRCKIGIVHDENCEWMGGVTGHAGVFSTTNDLASFCAMIMAKGRHQGKQIIKENLIMDSFKNYTPNLNEDRGYAWKSFDNYLHSGKIYGHLGFTGTSIWIDLQSDMFSILLTNRVHPDRNRFLSIQQVRKDVKDMCCKLVNDTY